MHSSRLVWPCRLKKVCHGSVAIPSNPLSLTLEGVLVVIGCKKKWFFFCSSSLFAWSFAVASGGWWSQCPLAGANCDRPVCLSRDPLVCPLIAGFLGPAARNCVRVEPIYAKDRSLDPLCHRSVWQYSARCLRPFFKFEDSPLGQPAFGLAPSWLLHFFRLEGSNFAPWCLLMSRNAPRLQPPLRRVCMRFCQMVGPMGDCW